MTICTTLNAIKKHKPCREGWVKLLAGLHKYRADDEPLPFSRIVKINGIDDALWATRAAPEHDKEWRLFAVWCARSVSHLSNDWRVTEAICIAERYAHGMASKEQLDAARAAVDAAWDAGDAAWNAAWNAELAARAAELAAARAAELAAELAAGDAAWNAAWNAELAARAAGDAQQSKFLEIVNG